MQNVGFLMTRLISSCWYSLDVIYFCECGIKFEMIEVKFGRKLEYEGLYCVLKNQPHMAYQSLYFSIFLSFQQFFHLISPASMSATVFKYCIHDEDNQVYYCKQNHDAEIYFCLLFLFFLFSICHSNVMNMEIFVKDFSGTT